MLKNTHGPSLAPPASGLKLDESGIWRSRHSASISYPEEANASCYQLEDASFWFGHRNDCIIATVKLFPPVGPVLDVGGGNGFVTRRLLDEGFAATLLEPGMAGALNGKTARKIPEVICSALEDTHFQPESVSAVGCFDVIEHIKDDAAFVNQLKQIMKPDGMLYLTVPAYQWLWSRSDVVAGHYRRYDRKGISALLSPHFNVLYITYFFQCLTIPVLFFRALPSHFFRHNDDRYALSSKAEHGVSGGRLVAALRFLLRSECMAIARGKTKSYGASILVVASKKNRIEQ